MLNTKALVISFAILWGGSILGLGIMANFGYGVEFVTLLSSVYIGYSTSPLGILIGTIWAMVDAAVGALIFALLYNYFSCMDE
tara:strand:- start:8250 stop:8498 length:249 start_codon:yes stop_codon:yes gene_type:complete